MTTSPTPDPDLPARVTAALAKAEIVNKRIGTTDHPGHHIPEIHLTFDAEHGEHRLSVSAEWAAFRYARYFRGSWILHDGALPVRYERIVSLTRSVLSGGVAADVATRLGVPFTTDALLGWAFDREWNPLIEGSMRPDAKVYASVNPPGPDFYPGHADTAAEALAAACLAALDRAEGA